MEGLKKIEYVFFLNAISITNSRQVILLSLSKMQIKIIMTKTKSIRRMPSQNSKKSLIIHYIIHQKSICSSFSILLLFQKFQKERSARKHSRAGSWIIEQNFFIKTIGFPRLATDFSCRQKFKMPIISLLV